MRLIIQRVLKAKVSVEKKNIAEINHGLFVLVGISIKDSKKEAEILSEKLFKLRVMRDKNDKMNLSLKDFGGEFLIVSQFTLYADTKGGNRPSFIQAAGSEIAKPIYDHFVEAVRKFGIPVKTGAFGEYMEIEAVLDGPVTIVVDSSSN